METPLEIRFTPEKDDYVRASRSLASKTPTFIVLAAILAVIAIAAIVLLIAPSIGNGRYTNAAVVVLVVAAFYVLYYLFLIPWQLSKSYKGNQYLQKERKLIFDADKVTMHVGDKKSDLFWENFEKVMDGKTLYLLIYKAEESVYPFIPKRAFQDAAAEDAFKQILAEKSIPLA